MRGGVTPQPKPAGGLDREVRAALAMVVAGCISFAASALAAERLYYLWCRLFLNSDGFVPFMALLATVAAVTVGAVAIAFQWATREPPSEPEEGDVCPKCKQRGAYR